MNPNIVLNLDEERKPEYIVLGGKEIDISFIPCGVSIPLMNKYDEYFKSLKSSKVLNDDGTVNENAEKELSKDTEKAANNLKIMIEMISMFTSYVDEEMNQEWIEKRLTIKQIPLFMSLLVKAITKDIQGTGGKKSDKKKENGSE